MSYKLKDLDNKKLKKYIPFLKRIKEDYECHQQPKPEKEL